MAKTTVIVNQGARPYHLKPKLEKDKDGKEHFVRRILPPGGSIEALDEEEAKSLLQYRDLKDADKIVPQRADRIAQLEAENADLRAKLGQLQTAQAEENKKPAKGRYDK